MLENRLFIVKNGQNFSLRQVLFAVNPESSPKMRKGYLTTTLSFE